ncbi:hypothetical protein NC653_026645 [Populus alba x Populus x berolinensis]|uniref:CSC1/OSCA1-like N-terminal transmembrane domain-containing protein n=1 Tax=Populus alba x Populus x berolinensis TaxID=444605 RepID=A0AAD6Q9H5_9ROSI|nr:hypothetical protein NC653_026645 [Populus alba x Populus x berolinensis]
MNMIPARVLLAINQAQQTQISNLSIHGLAAHNNISRTSTRFYCCKCLLYRYELTIAPHVRFVFEFFTQEEHFASLNKQQLPQQNPNSTRPWKLSEEEMLSSSGLDAVVYMRMITFCLKVFSFAGIIGILILLPVNCSGTELHQIDFA